MSYVSLSDATCSDFYLDEEVRETWEEDSIQKDDEMGEKFIVLENLPN